MTKISAILFNIIEDQFFNWAWTNFPSIVACVFLMWLTWWVSGRVTDYRNRFTKIESDCVQLNTNQVVTNWRLSGIDIKIAALDSKVTAQDNKVTVLDSKVTAIESKLTTLILHLSATKKIDPNLLKSQSPIELTEIGVKILEEMGGRGYIDTNLPSLISQMEEQDFKSGLDVQNYCSMLLTDKTGDDALIPVRNYVSRTPSYRINDTTAITLDITVAVMIMGVYLRNKYFEKHPSLSGGIS